MIDPYHILLVALGGALGGAGRYWLTGVVDRRIGELFPWGTLVVNASGALLIGLVAAGRGAESAASPVWIFAALGVLGSYTTVSSFSLQTLALLRNGETTRAMLNVALSFGLCLGGALVGFVAGARIPGPW